MSGGERALAGRAVRGGVALMAARLVVQGFTWAVTFLVARLLEPSDYGVMTWGTVFLGLAELLGEAGMGRALIQKEELGPDDIHQAFTASLVLSAVLYAALFVSADTLAVRLGTPELALLLRVMGVTLALLPLRTVSLALLDREQKLGRQALVLGLTGGIQAALVLGLAWAGAGYWALAVGAITARTTEAVSLSLIARWWPRLVWPGRDARGLLAFGLSASGASFLWFVYSNADFYVVGSLFGTVELGYYSLAFQLMSIPVQRLTAGVNQVAYPVYCRLQGDPARLRGWYLRLTVLIGFLGMPALVGLALIAGDAVPQILGEKWGPAVMPFRLLALTGVVMLYAATISPLLNALGRPGTVLAYAAACCTLMPAAFFVGGLLGGVQGVCVAWLTVFPLIVLALGWLTRGVTGVGPLEFARAQMPVIVATLAMAGAVLAALWPLADAARPLRLGVCIALGAAVYAGVMLLVGRAVLRDVRALWAELRGGG